MINDRLRWCYPGGIGDRGVKLTTHLCLVPRLSCVELYLHSPSMSSGPGVYLIKIYVFMEWCLVKHRDKKTFAFLYVLCVLSVG